MCGIFAYRGDAESSKLKKSFQLIQHRGPDESRLVMVSPQITLGFHRLAIMDLSEKGMQPFHDSSTGDFLICNGEIYNFQKLKEELPLQHYSSNSDCEILLPLIHRYGFESAIRKLDGEFALVYYSHSENILYAARDALGVRPLFIGESSGTRELGFASEMKALHHLFTEIKPFPPAHIFQERKRFARFTSLTQFGPESQPCPGENFDLTSSTSDTLNSSIQKMIRQKLIDGIEKRLVADAPLGFLLSGGVDSSLVCGVAAKTLGKKIETFSVGCHIDAIDLQYARKVAKYIDSHHHEIYFSIDEALNVIDDVIYSIESWDITTIRASIGMYLVCKGIRDHSSIRSLLTGEVSDELFGYKYTDFAPSADEFQKESIKRVDELHYYDVLRADRCIAHHGLEARVPFSDSEFIRSVITIPPEMKLNRNGIGKFLLRKAFEADQLIPFEILMREKAAFSDAVGHSVVDSIKALVDNIITDNDLKNAQADFPYHPPQTKEALYYRRIFTKHYPGRDQLIPGYWLPNQSWPGCQVSDPSARVLSNYGKSGT